MFIIFKNSSRKEIKNEKKNINNNPLSSRNILNNGQNNNNIINKDFNNNITIVKNENIIYYNKKNSSNSNLYSVCNSPRAEDKKYFDNVESIPHDYNNNDYSADLNLLHDMVSDLNSKRKSINNIDKNEIENKNIENQGKFASRNSRIITAFIDYSNKKNKNITPKNEKENMNLDNNIKNNNISDSNNNKKKLKNKVIFLEQIFLMFFKRKMMN